MYDRARSLDRDIVRGPRPRLQLLAGIILLMRSKACHLLCVFLFTSIPVFAQGVRDHTRPGAAADPARARYRLGNNTKAAGATVSDTQAEDVTLTLNPVSVRPIQTWVRTGGRIGKDGKTVTVGVQAPESSFVQVGQRARAFPPESKSSMFQGYVTKVSATPGGAEVEVTLSGKGHPGALSYVVEIVTERGEFLAIPNEAIIEEGGRRIVYVPRDAGQYAPVEIQTGIQGELYTAVEKGLKEGDQVVSFGSFFIDSEYKLKSSAQAPQ